MERRQINVFITRIWLLICACVVLGTSADLSKVVEDFCDHLRRAGGSCAERPLLNPLDYCIFVGAWGLVQVLVGIVGVFATAIPWIAVIVIDALALIFYLAGGIDLATIANNDGDCSGNTRCAEFRADIAFLFLGFFGSIAAIALVVIRQRRR